MDIKIRVEVDDKKFDLVIPSDIKKPLSQEVSDVWGDAVSVILYRATRGEVL